MKQMTRTELITEVTKFYNGALNLHKALQIFEIEYGYKPEIINPKNIISCSDNYPEFITTGALSYMKELQDSGAVNMMKSVPYIQNALGFTRKEAIELLTIYITDYTKIYHPEELL
jgi:hypothetical protein